MEKIKELTQDDFDKSIYVHLSKLRLGDLVVFHVDETLQGIVSDIKLLDDEYRVYYDGSSTVYTSHLVKGFKKMAKPAINKNDNEKSKIDGIDIQTLKEAASFIFIVFKREPFFVYLTLLAKSKFLTYTKKFKKAIEAWKNG